MKFPALLKLWPLKLLSPPHPVVYWFSGQLMTFPELLNFLPPGWVKFVWDRMIPGSIRTWVSNFVAVRRSCRRGGGTDRHTQRDTAALYSRLAGYPASLGPLPPVRPSLSPSLESLPPSPPPSFHPRITRLRSEYLCKSFRIIAFPKVSLKFGRLNFPTGGGGNFFIDLSTDHEISRILLPLKLHPIPLWWGGG